MTPRLLITGSRGWTDVDLIDTMLALYWIKTGSDPEATLVHGACPTGVDAIASQIWESHGLPVEAHPADWKTHGRAAGFIRNKRMADSNIDVCYAFIYNNSNGARHCANYAESVGVPTYRWTINDE